MRCTSRRTEGPAGELRIADPVLASRAWQWGGRVLILALLGVSAAQAAVATFDDLVLPPEGHWNGADGAGGFASGAVWFANHYDAEWDFWDGFAYSNHTDPNLGPCFPNPPDPARIPNPENPHPCPYAAGIIRSRHHQDGAF